MRCCSQTSLESFGGRFVVGRVGRSCQTYLGTLAEDLLRFLEALEGLLDWDLLVLVEVLVEVLVVGLVEGLGVAVAVALEVPLEVPLVLEEVVLVPTPLLIQHHN